MGEIGGDLLTGMRMVGEEGLRMRIEELGLCQGLGIEKDLSKGVGAEAEAGVGLGKEGDVKELGKEATVEKI